MTAIVGATATGKSALALALAERAGAEIVSFDSQQVYRGLDVGTGKVSAADRARVPHHGLDLVGPAEEMTAARFAGVADAAIADIHARGKPVVLVGGTGLYLRTLLYGLFEGPPMDPALRARLEAQAARDGVESLHRDLAAIDPQSAARIMPRDKLRLIRALEVHAQTGVTMSAHQAAHDHKTQPPRHAARILGLDPPNEILRPAVEARVASIFDAGLVAEVRALLAAGVPETSRSLLAIGYAEALAVLRGDYDEPTARQKVISATWRYARRQRGWFRAERDVVWFAAAADVDLDAEAERLLQGAGVA